MSAAPVIGSIELLRLALYLWRRSAVAGAVLLTGFLGGAVATHLRTIAVASARSRSTIKPSVTRASRS